MIQIEYSYFNVEDGNIMTIEERIQEILKTISKENEYLQFEDGKQCHNEEELRQILKEGGVL